MNSQIGSLIYRVQGRKTEVLLRKSIDNIWTFPKGVILSHEQVHDSIKRVSLQYMGYNVIAGSLVGEYRTNNSKLYVYLSTAANQENFDENETSMVKWFTFKEAARMINKTTTRQIKEIDLQILSNSAIVLLSGIR